MVVRSPLGTALTALVLALVLGLALGGCGDGSGDGSGDDAVVSGPPTATSRSTDGGSTDGGSVDFELVDTITVSSAGGAVSDVGVPLADEAAVQGFVAQFVNEQLAGEVRDAIASTDVPEGQALYAAVVAVGCDSPDQVTVTDGGSGPVITAVKVATPHVECLVAMTTVALVLVSDYGVGGGGAS
jgi:hypothetical protein